MNEGELELRLYKLKEKMKTRRVVIESPAGLLSRIRERTSMKEEDNIMEIKPEFHKEFTGMVNKALVKKTKYDEMGEAEKKADKKMMIIIVVGVGLLFLIALLSARAMG